MWIDRKAYDTMIVERAKLCEESRVLNQQMSALLTTLDWIRVRLTQVETERAQMIERYTGVRIPVPVITRTDADQSPMSQVPNWNDVGDDAAAKFGLSWNEDGTIRYRDQ